MKYTAADYKKWLAKKLIIGLFFPAVVASISAGPRGTNFTILQKMDVDEQFRQARILAQQGRREEARTICVSILANKPDYFDVRVYLGRLFAWDKDYTEARREFLRVLESRPDYLDARSAMVDVEYWSGNLDSALFHCDRGLSQDPRNRELLLKKSRILYRLEDYSSAAVAVQSLLLLDPAHSQGLELLDRIRYATETFKVAQKYRFDALHRSDGEIRPWHLFTLEGSMQTPPGSVIGRINIASRNFGSTTRRGLQYEIDAYPKFADGIYAYLNAGYSANAVFPRYRLGGEIYSSLPQSFEVSAGIRYLDFSSSVVQIYTGSLGKYYRNYWFSLRPFITDKPSGLSVSMLFLARRYYESRDTYVGIQAGYGSTPVDIFYLEDIERLNSFKFGVDWKKVLTRTLLAQVVARFEWEEVAPERYGSRITVMIKFEERFFRKY